MVSVVIIQQCKLKNFFFPLSRHSQILAANNIPQDKILNPKELATMRADRIAKEKAQAVVAVSSTNISLEPYIK